MCSIEIPRDNNSHRISLVPREKEGDRVNPISPVEKKPEVKKDPERGEYIPEEKEGQKYEEELVNTEEAQEHDGGDLDVIG